MARVVNQRESQGFMWGDWALSDVTKGFPDLFFMFEKRKVRDWLSLDHVSSFTCQRKYNSFCTYGAFNWFYDVNVVFVKVSRKNQVQLWILLCISGAQHQQGAECWWRGKQGGSTSSEISIKAAVGGVWRRKRLTDGLVRKSENTHKSPACHSPCEECSARLQAVTQRNGHVCWKEGCKACRGKSEFLSLPAKCIMGAFRAR